MATVLESVLATVFEVTVQLPLEIGSAAQRSASAAPSAPNVWALVGIEGSRRYCVVLESSERLARRIAGSMLAETFPEWTHEVEDAIAELANIVAGNIKAVLPEHLQLTLSLPSVIHGREAFWSAPKLNVIAEQVFSCEGECLRVSLGDELAPRTAA